MRMAARKTPSPLKHALELMDQAMLIAESYGRNASRAFSNDDITQFDVLLAALWANHCMLEHILNNLRVQNLGAAESDSSCRYFPELG